MKKIINKVLFETGKYLLITAILWGIVFCGYSLNGMSDTKIYNYTLENSESGATSFLPINPPYYYNYRFFVSEDTDKNTEIRIFEATNVALSEFFPLFRSRYKNYLTATTDKTVGSLYFQLDGSAEGVNDVPNTVLLYYSNNKEKISRITYTVKNLDSGETEEITQKINPHNCFMIIIQCTFNHDNNHNEVLEASFYDSQGALIFKDNRSN